MAPLVGRFFGKEGEKLDKYGANLSSAALSGKGHCVLHNNLQSIVASIMKLCGLLAVKESAKFLIGKVGEPYIGSYINHVSQHPNPKTAKHAIVPDVHIHVHALD